MNITLIIIITITITWGLLNRYVYSHQAYIDILWKEIFEYTTEIAKSRKLYEEVGMYDMLELFERKSNRAGRLINALLDYYYPNLELQDNDQKEYVEKYHYIEKHDYT